MKKYNIFYATDKVGENKVSEEYLLGIYDNFSYGLYEMNKKFGKNQVYCTFHLKELDNRDIKALTDNIELLTEEKNHLTDCGLELLEIVKEFNKSNKKEDPEQA